MAEIKLKLKITQNAEVCRALNHIKFIVLSQGYMYWPVLSGALWCKNFFGQKTWKFQLKSAFNQLKIV